jgi:hypothetical protein
VFLKCRLLVVLTAGKEMGGWHRQSRCGICSVGFDFLVCRTPSVLSVRFLTLEDARSLVVHHAKSTRVQGADVVMKSNGAD